MNAEPIDAIRATLAAEGVASDQGIAETLGDALRMGTTQDCISLPAACIGEGGDFEPRQELGRGAMGSVEVARQRALDRDVAIKRLHSADPAHVQALLEEATLAGQLEHPNIVPIHAVVADERGPAVVMKRISGVPWSQLIAEGETPLARHLEILLQLCRAVAFAHSRNVVHRDIKPSNVMIGEFGEVVLVDWGLARRLGPEGEFVDSQISGTPAFMAPEMVDKRADGTSDVFLLGATLHEVLTGRLRHEGVTIPQVLHAATRVKTYAYGKNVDAELAAIANRACALERGDRFPTAQDFREALVAYLDHRAANQLTRVAQVRLAELENELDRGLLYDDAQRLYAEARFAFEQALSAWPESEAAGRGRERCLSTMVRYEIEQGHASQARAIMGAMDGPDAQLVERLELLEQAQGEEAKRIAEFERDRDPGDGADERSRAAWALGLSTILLVAVFVSLRMLAPSYAPGALRLLIVSLVVGTVGTAIVLRWSRNAELNLINRRISQVIVATLALSFVGRALGFARGSSVSDILHTDALILLGGSLALVPFHRAGVPLVFAALGLACAGALHPEWLERLFIGYALIVSLLVVWGRRRPVPA